MLSAIAVPREGTSKELKSLTYSAAFKSFPNEELNDSQGSIELLTGLRDKLMVLA